MIIKLIFNRFFLLTNFSKKPVIKFPISDPKYNKLVSKAKDKEPTII